MNKKTADGGSLNQVYDEFVQGKMDKAHFEKTVFTQLWQHCSSAGAAKNNEDCYSDFLVWLYPRLSAAMARFKADRGVPFEGFLYAIIRLAYREYKGTAKRRSDIEEVYWKETVFDNERSRECYREDALQEDQAHGADGGGTDGAAGRAAGRLTPKQVLLLALKSYYFLTEAKINRLLPHIGCGKELFEKKLEELRRMRSKHDVARESLRKRCHSQYCRCLLIEEKLAADGGTGGGGVLRRKLQRSRLRLDKMRSRLKSMRISATNRQLSQVLDIPKGTIDSTFFHLRRRPR